MKIRKVFFHSRPEQRKRWMKCFLRCLFDCIRFIVIFVSLSVNTGFLTDAPNNKSNRKHWFDTCDDKKKERENRNASLRFVRQFQTFNISFNWPMRTWESNNATIWVEQYLIYLFQLKHVPLLFYPPRSDTDERAGKDTQALLHRANKSFLHFEIALK